MFNVNAFSYEEAHGSYKTHIMMFVVELNTYVHIWAIEDESQMVVKMNVKGTTRQVKVTGKKKIAGLLDAARKMM